MEVAIVGLGLIGGSIARALAAAGAGWRVTAWNRDAAVVEAAAAQGVLAAAAPSPEQAVAGADLAVLCAAPAANLRLFDRLAPRLAGSATTLTDVTSVQRPLAVRAAAHPEVRFVGGHPMSGREQRGFVAADAALFHDRPWVVLPSPSASAEDVQRVEAVARACGAHPLRMDPAAHDAAVAAISHLPLLASLALVETVTPSDDWPIARGLAAQGWRGMVRLAAGDPELGAGIVGLNAAALRGWVERYRATLVRWEEMLQRLEHADDAATAAEDADLLAWMRRTAHAAADGPVPAEGPRGPAA